MSYYVIYDDFEIDTGCEWRGDWVQTVLIFRSLKKAKEWVKSAKTTKEDEHNIRRVIGPLVVVK